MNLGIEEKIKNIEKTEQAKAAQMHRRAGRRANTLGLEKVDTSLNYASSRYSYGPARHRSDNSDLLYDTAKRTAFEEGKTDKVEVRHDREREQAARRKPRTYVICVRVYVCVCVCVCARARVCVRVCAS